ncbi:hypothetical protein ACHAXT_010045 [Thalassiosira profunda]
MAARSRRSLTIWAVLLSVGTSLTTGFNVGSLTKRVGHHPSPSAVGPSSASVAKRLSSTKEDERPNIDPATKAELRSIANHIAKQTLEATLSQSEATAICDELLFDSESQSSIFNDNTYQQYVKYWAKVEARLREENQRTPADLLGRELTERILASIRGDAVGGKKGRSSGSYDAQTVRAFLDSDAVNSLFTQLLYDAIFEFTMKMDVLGNAISNLPLLGPVRNQVLKESKRNMDRTLGPVLQGFLSGYTRVAIRQAVEFVVSEENASAFGKANARLVSYLLEKRTVADWLPDEKVLAEWREEAWSYLVGLEEGDGDGEKVKEDQRKTVEQAIDWTYDLVGDKCVEDASIDVNAILDASPTLERSLASFWERCKDASKQA